MAKSNRSYTKADVQRLLKIDRELVELEVIIDKHLLSEAEVNKTTLLMSRAYKYKYDRLLRMRTNLTRSMSLRLSRQETYVAELAERKKAVQEAIEKRDGTARDMAQLLATQAVHKNDNFRDKYNTFTSLLRSQEIVIRNKQRAVDGWLQKDINSLPARRFNKPREVHQQQNSVVISVPSSNFTIKTHEPVSFAEPELDALSYGELENDPKWNVKAENNATIDLLTRPEEKKNESVD